jgi:alpha-N-arabinofuranosidase
MVFLGIRNFKSPMHMGHILGRETFLAPVTWDEQGWPVVNNNLPIKEKMEVKTLPQVPVENPIPQKDDFDKAQLEMCWNFLRNPDSTSWSLKENKGALTLRGSSHTLDSLGSPAFVGRRQEYLYGKASTLLRFSPRKENEEAGLTVFMADKFHYDIAVTMKNGKRKLIVRRTVDDINFIPASADLPEGDVKLIIESNPWAYMFYYQTKDGIIKKIAHCQSMLLSTEVSGGFTGMYIGMYTTGNGKKVTSPALFDWFEYEDLSKK